MPDLATPVRQAFHARLLRAIALPAVFLSVANPAIGAQQTLEPGTDDVQITASATMALPEGVVFADVNRNGVIHITTDGVTLDFTDSPPLRGAPEGTPGDELEGIGVYIDGAKDVTIKGLRAHGYRCAIFASNADGLTIDGGDFSFNRRNRLFSTPRYWDLFDWNGGMENDQGEWFTYNGSAVYIGDSDDITIRNITIHSGRNGIILDRVDHSEIYDNDVSFMSGWGLALWRSSSNTISRNAFDFCVRSHEEGVYNVGSESAGIFFAEQCSNNVVIENSVTHGGDGFLGFAGREALGQQEAADNNTDSFRRRGCNDNVFIRNDFSHASIHGLELTYSFGNVVKGNRFFGNGVCGIWGGYSQEFLITDNYFERNGQLPKGRERGGINIEHGAGNHIAGNRFRDDCVAIRIWHDDPWQIKGTPWEQANYRGVVDNTITDNTFSLSDGSVTRGIDNADGCEIIMQFYQVQHGAVRNLRVFGNTYLVPEGGPEPVVTSGGVEVLTSGRRQAETDHREHRAIGVSAPIEIIGGVPVSARASYGGRDAIIMHDWGPWNHEGLLVRKVESSHGFDVYEVHGTSPHAEIQISGVDLIPVPVVPGSADFGQSRETIHMVDTDSLAVSTWWERDRIVVRLESRGDESVVPYAFSVVDGTLTQQVRGAIQAIDWEGTAFSWVGGPDPRTDFEQWAELAQSRTAIEFTTQDALLRFQGGGPMHLFYAGTDVQALNSRQELEDCGIENDHFGIRLEATIDLEAGEYHVSTLSDDGVRVYASINSEDPELVIENWTHHSPTLDRGVLSLDTRSEVRFAIYHFDLIGYSILDFNIDYVPLIVE